MRELECNMAHIAAGVSELSQPSVFDGDITFYTDETGSPVECGRLWWKGGILSFEGNVEESAKVVFEQVVERNRARIMRSNSGVHDGSEVESLHIEADRYVQTICDLKHQIISGNARERVTRDALMNAQAFAPCPMYLDALAQPPDDTALNTMLAAERVAGQLKAAQRIMEMWVNSTPYEFSILLREYIEDLNENDA
jgi:hypothetical protein